MAKILVADDNSNIQRMVGLALKDQGIEVVAVGNGEAAVRKISEIHPDLVLADVFMPVRNGYEVCQYVKQNSSLAHIPVILLIGAFDPLDEQEAQKVGSDGVLKKPFVPPDPLISMVKNALQKAGVSLSGAGSPKGASSSRKSTDASPAAPVNQPTEPPKPSSPLAGLKFSRFAPAPPAVVEPPAPNLQEMSFVEEPAAPAPVTIAPSDNVMAFENLLGSTTTEEPSFVSSAPEPLAVEEAEETVDVPEEPEPADSEISEHHHAAASTASSWTRGSAEEPFTEDESVGAVKDWRDSEVAQTAGRRTPMEEWEQSQATGGNASRRIAEDVPGDLGAFTSELSALETESRAGNSAAVSEQEATAAQPEETQSTSASEEVSSTPHGSAQPSYEPRNAIEEPAAPEGFTQEQPGVSADEFGRPEEAFVASQISQPETAATEEPVANADSEATQQPSSESQAAQPVAPEEAQLHDVLHELEQAKHEPAPFEEQSAPHTEEKISEREPVNSWFSRPASPWDTEPHRSNPLASAWGSSRTAAVAEPEVTRDAQPDVQSETHPEVPAETHSEVHREVHGDDQAESRGANAAHESGEPQEHSAESSRSHGANGQSSSHDMEEVVAAEPAAQENAAPAETPHGAPPQPEVDELVARVLAKMNPEVLQAVTREILKPMVAAILAEEAKRKE